MAICEIDGGSPYDSRMFHESPYILYANEGEFTRALAGLLEVSGGPIDGLCRGTTVFERPNSNRFHLQTRLGWITSIVDIVVDIGEAPSSADAAMIPFRISGSISNRSRN